MFRGETGSTASTCEGDLSILQICKAGLAAGALAWVLSSLAHGLGMGQPGTPLGPGSPDQQDA